MRLALSALAALAALTLACSGRSPVEGDQTGPDSFAQLHTGTVLVDGATPLPPDPYTVDRAAVRNDSLLVTVRYGGGCRTHEFTLQLFKTFRESYPVQSDALIAHRANGDHCKALLVRELAFDLAPLRDHYRASYQTLSGVIRLRLLPPAQGEVEYRF